MLADAVWGAGGDALGVPYEFRGRCTFECEGMVGHGTDDQPAGTWSDDTALMLATCDSIRSVGRVDADDLLARFRSWYYDGAYTPDGSVFDVGNATAEALRTGRVLAAVNLGDDTDTTACVAGALTGTAYGMASIPGEWLAAMRGREVLEATLF